MIRVVLSALFLASLAAGQCFGIHPTLNVTGLVGVPAPGCNEINPSQNVPFLSVNGAPSASIPMQLNYVWSNIPTYATAPSTYQGFVAIDLTQPPPYQLLGTTSPSCFMTVGPTVMVWQTLVPVTNGCVSTPFGQIPAIPGMAFVSFYSQGILWDLTINRFAITKPFVFQFFP